MILSGKRKVPVILRGALCELIHNPASDRSSQAESRPDSHLDLPLQVSFCLGCLFPSSRVAGVKPSLPLKPLLPRRLCSSLRE